MGDPAGIGPEIIVKAFADEDFLQTCRGIVVGDTATLEIQVRQLGLNLEVCPVTQIGQARFGPNRLNVLDLHNVPQGLALGVPGPDGGKASVEYIRRAVDLVLRQEADALTTAPINKESLHRAGFTYPGHTELLAEYTGAPHSVLMLAGDRLRVVLVTTHVPLHRVQPLITRERILTTLRLTHRWLSEYVTPRPKIAVTGLNPHCGDGGIFGDEEIQSIAPAIGDAQKENIDATGPFSADALFARHQGYDAVVTMYHDQGMIPVKMANLGRAVNITLGLPIIRTSVDHGTAYDIAGRGLASPESLKNAVAAACRLATRGTPLSQPK
ncbi:MAG: 4-hydroxythreonine-4-phosphate dehydrogenase PdxA [Nitrospinae bacterium CG11_big_fil_rev_8_21_14_0_20_56_8]|nr:MAG: 4-hydroxythreonine-4-phosphate dehydrogenase PdxA [Nitrospinae bacterium CG11_big_fil_rev_8_21_14_0_20_56_8]